MIDNLKPEDIEKRSFEIIRSELPREIDPGLAPIILRVIHTTADFEYLDNLVFSEGVIEKAVAALHKGALIISDTNMVKAGIDKTRLAAFGGRADCFVADADVAEAARKNGSTRSKEAVDKAVDQARNQDMPVIFAIGNAPTALVRICELADKFKPDLVIGVPVGFVNVVESKEILMNSGIPYIAAKGRKGGSNVAAAICNALFRIAADQ